MSNSKRIVLFTSGFPYGKGEKSFIIPELESLRKKYQVAIIAHPPGRDLANKEYATALDPKIQLYSIKCDLSVMEKLFFSLLGIVNIGFFLETLKIFTSGHERRLKQFVDALSFSAHAEYFYYHFMRLKDFKRKKGDIYYTYWNHTYTLALARHRKNMNFAALISRAHGGDLYNEIRDSGRQPFKEEILKGVDAMIFISRAGKEYFKKNWPGYDDKLFLFPLGVASWGRTIQSVSNSGTFRIVSCSNAIADKRIDLIIDGLSYTDFDFCGYEQIHWIHFGDGNELNKLKKIAEKKLKNINKIKYEFRGYCSNDTIRSFYIDNPISCFITTSASEGSPVSIKEAMSAAIPIIGTAVGGIPDLIKGNGILLSSTPDEAEVSNAIQKFLYLSPEQLNTLGKRSFDVWNEECNIDKTNSRFIDFLNHIGARACDNIQ